MFVLFLFFLFSTCSALIWRCESFYLVGIFILLFYFVQRMRACVYVWMNSSALKRKCRSLHIISVLLSFSIHSELGFLVNQLKNLPVRWLCIVSDSNSKRWEFHPQHECVYFCVRCMWSSPRLYVSKASVFQFFYIRLWTYQLRGIVFFFPLSLPRRHNIE